MRNFWNPAYWFAKEKEERREKKRTTTRKTKQNTVSVVEVVSTLRGSSALPVTYLVLTYLNLTYLVLTYLILSYLADSSHLLSSYFTMLLIFVRFLQCFPL